MIINYSVEVLIKECITVGVLNIYDKDGPCSAQVPHFFLILNFFVALSIFNTFMPEESTSQLGSLHF